MNDPSVNLPVNSSQSFASIDQSLAQSISDIVIFYQSITGRFTQGEQGYEIPSVNLPVNSSQSFASIDQSLAQSISDIVITAKIRT